MASTALQDRAPSIPTRAARAGRAEGLPSSALPTPSGVADAVYFALERAARFGRPCPTDLALARRARAPLAATKAALRELAATGAIRIDRVRAPTLRRVWIRATCKKTGEVRA